jgi:hypothetical protein
VKSVEQKARFFFQTDVQKIPSLKTRGTSPAAQGRILIKSVVSEKVPFQCPYVLLGIGLRQRFIAVHTGLCTLYCTVQYTISLIYLSSIYYVKAILWRLN